jgi:hypothetical protein
MHKVRVLRGSRAMAQGGEKLNSLIQGALSAPLFLVALVPFLFGSIKEVKIKHKVRGLEPSAIGTVIFSKYEEV